MGIINLLINDKQIATEAGKTVLEVCRANGIDVPTLCSHPTLKPAEVCGVCVVALDGDLIKSCSKLAVDGMKIYTENDQIASAREKALEEILVAHPNDCLRCVKSGGNCQLQEVSYLYNVDPPERKEMNRGTDHSSPAIERDLDKCIACERCLKVCEEVQKIDVYEKVSVEGDSYVNTKKGLPLSETGCIYCGQCVKRCPVAALVEKSEVHQAASALRDPSKTVVFQMAPAIHHTLGEAFGLSGVDVTKKLPAAIHALGATAFTTQFSADVTIMEEGTELISRLNDKGTLPMFTSCCPAWVKFVETYYPQLIGNLSSTKSPQQMLGALVKSYYAEKENIAPEDIFHISIMPCIAKKYERQRGEMNKDVDAVITTREFVKLLRWFNIDLAELEDSEFDPLLSEGTGAARIFAVSGGVMEATLRTVVSKLSENKMDKLDFIEKQDSQGIKVAKLDIGNGTNIKVAVVNGIGNARAILDEIAAGKGSYNYIEFMACEGGCIGGGGAPVKGENETRLDSVCQSDAVNPVRRSHENQEVTTLYTNFLDKPCGQKSHELLHTHYTDKSGECHRKLPVSPKVRSQLDDINGIGPARRKALMNHFNSIENIKNAELSELEQTKGMNKKAAEAVYNHFRSV